MVKPTALVKAKNRFEKLIVAFPEQADEYRSKIEELTEQIIASGACRRCGRPLKTEEARAIGYGKECQTKAEAEIASEE